MTVVRTLALAGLLAVVGPASAQFYHPPAPAMPGGGFPPNTSFYPPPRSVADLPAPVGYYQTTVYPSWGSGSFSTYSAPVFPPAPYSSRYLTPYAPPPPQYTTRYGWR